MERRTFLKNAAISSAGVAAVAASFPKPALSQNLRKWRMVTTWPKNLPGLGTGAQYFADQVTKCTGGRLTVQLAAAGEIVPAFESIDAVKSGTVEMGHGCPYYWKGKAAAAELVSNFPFGLTAQEYNAWYHFGGGDKLCDELYESAFGCKFLPCGNTGVQHPGWSRKEVNTLADFQGLKMRMPGLGGEIMKRLGATVVNLPGSEVPTALAAGTIDWAEWNNPYGEASMGFWRHAKYYYATGWHEPGTVLELFVNKAQWDGLEPDLKAIVEQCAYATNVVMLSEFQARSGPVLEQFVQKHGVIIKKLNDEQIKKIGEMAATVLMEVTGKDALSKKVFDSMNKFRGQQKGYSDVAEADFLRARSLDFSWPA
ncbi:MAG: TRAP transporter substrate-binding protein [Hyphomicrobiaceae bacterium]|nr:TRAP transporter substrate-binding protein [Hyphomicrobiaceae bacterium]